MAAITTEAQVREVGGLSDRSATGDWNLFRYESDAELTVAITNAIAVASSWIQLRIDTGIYASADTNIQTVLSLAEAYLSLHFLVPALKARRVFGTHYALETQEAAAYAELIDVEWMALARELIDAWVIIDTPGSVYAKPRMRVGTAINPLDPGFESMETELLETLDRARSLTLPPL